MIHYKDINTIELAIQAFENRSIPTKCFNDFKKIQPAIATHPKIIALALHNGLEFSEVDEEHLTFEIVKNVLTYHPNKYPELPLKYKSDVSLSLMCAEFDGSLMCYAPESIKRDKRVVAAAIKSKPSSIGWFSPSVLKHIEINRNAVDRVDYSDRALAAKFQLHV